MKAYHDLVRNVLDTATRKENRTGVDTLSTFHHSYELGFGLRMLRDDYCVHSSPRGGHYHLGDGFPLLTTKKMSWKNIVVEMLWFLSGHTDVDLLRRHGCRFWDAWAHPETGEVPSAYGSFWRSFPIHLHHPDGSIAAGYSDQIRWVLGELKRSPMSRRLVVSAWDPASAQTSALPPCHLLYVFNVQRDREGEPRLCLHMTQRSCDVALGVPYNIASYALLLHLVSRLSGISPGIFAHTLVDSHIYTCRADGSMMEYDHVPGLVSQLDRRPRPLPRLQISDDIRDLDDVERLFGATTEEVMAHFVLDGYDPHPEISFRVAV